jgi:hypothetical protein
MAPVDDASFFLMRRFTAMSPTTTTFAGATGIFFSRIKKDINRFHF